MFRMADSHAKTNSTYAHRSCSTQEFNTGELVFISMYLYYDYYVNFDWCRVTMLVYISAQVANLRLDMEF